MDCYKYGYKYGSLAKRTKLDPPIILPTKVSLVQCNVQLSDYLRYLYWAEFSLSYCYYIRSVCSRTKKAGGLQVQVK